MNADVVAIIPARSGSKGVPNKNIKLLSGIPLLAYSIKVAQLARNVDRIIVSTDSKEYAKIARDYGAEVPFLRPQSMAEDKSSDYEYMRHLIDYFKDLGQLPKYIAHIRPTTPLREVSYIEQAIETLKGNKNATALRSIHEMSQSSYKTFEVENSLLKCICTGSFSLDSANNARQGYPKTYDPNGYIDVLSTSFILNENKLHGDKVLAFITPYAPEVDTEEDFDYLEFLISKKHYLEKVTPLIFTNKH